MEMSVYDMVVDEMISRHRAVKEELRSRFKKTKPFRQEPVTKKELIMDYDELTTNEPQLRQDFGNEAIDKYKMELEAKLLGR